MKKEGLVARRHNRTRLPPNLWSKLPYMVSRSEWQEILLVWKAYMGVDVKTWSGFLT